MFLKTENDVSAVLRKHSRMYRPLCFSVLCLSIPISASHRQSLQTRSRSQQFILCRSLNAKALQETASEGLVQGPYVAARARFEPMTLRSKGNDSNQCATTSN